MSTFFEEDFEDILALEPFSEEVFCHPALCFPHCRFSLGLTDNGLQQVKAHEVLLETLQSDALESQLKIGFVSDFVARELLFLNLHLSRLLLILLLHGCILLFRPAEFDAAKLEFWQLDRLSKEFPFLFLLQYGLHI